MKRAFKPNSAGIAQIAEQIENRQPREWFWHIGQLLLAMMPSTRRKRYAKCCVKTIAAELGVSVRQLHHFVRIAKEFQLEELESLPTCEVSSVREVLRLKNRSERLEVLRTCQKHAQVKEKVDRINRDERKTAPIERCH